MPRPPSPYPLLDQHGRVNPSLKEKKGGCFLKKIMKYFNICKCGKKADDQSMETNRLQGNGGERRDRHHIPTPVVFRPGLPHDHERTSADDPGMNRSQTQNDAVQIEEEFIYGVHFL